MRYIFTAHLSYLRSEVTHLILRIYSEIVQLVGTESEILDLFSGSLEEPYYLGIYSQDQVSDFRQKIGQMSRKYISHFIVKMNNLNKFCNEVANRYNEKQ